MSERQRGVLGTRLQNGWKGGQHCDKQEGAKPNCGVRTRLPQLRTSFWEGQLGGDAGRKVEERTLPTAVSLPPRGTPQVVVVAPLLPQSRHTPDSPFLPGGKREAGGNRDLGGRRDEEKVGG